MAYDARQARLLAVGDDGYWSFVGGRWIRVDNTPAGLPTSFAAAVYDNDVNSILLFGGQGAGGPSSDLWAFDGRRWEKRDAASPPPPRAHPALAYDDKEGALVVFGGAAAGGAPLGDTWLWTAKDGWRSVS